MKLRSGKTISEPIIQTEDVVLKCIWIHMPIIKQKLNLLNSIVNVVDRMKLIMEIYEYIYDNLNELHEAGKMSPKWEKFYNLMQSKAWELSFQVCRQCDVLESVEDMELCIKCIDTLGKVLQN